MSDQIVIYQTPDGTTGIEVHLKAETVWLTQDQMADLFGRERSVITKQLHNIFKEGGLAKTAVRAKFAHTAPDGKKGPRNQGMGSGLYRLLKKFFFVIASEARQSCL